MNSNHDNGGLHGNLQNYGQAAKYAWTRNDLYKKMGTGLVRK